MANSIVGTGNGQSANGITANVQMIQQIKNFQKNYKGDPKQAVMQMLQQGQITNPQLQQAMQMAKQIQNLIK